MRQSVFTFYPKKEKFGSSFSCWRWVREDFVELFFVVFALGRQQIHQCCFDLTGHTRRVSPSPLPLKHFGPPVSFVKQSFEREREKKISVFWPHRTCSDVHLPFCSDVDGCDTTIRLSPEFFFSFRYFSSERFSNFFFKHSLKSFYARYFYFIFFFFSKMGTHLSSLISRWIFWQTLPSNLSNVSRLLQPAEFPVTSRIDRNCQTRPSGRERELKNNFF